MSQPKSTITMKDVAKRAGVSTATVSRAFSHPEKLSLNTRLRVEEAIMSCRYSGQNQMGYPEAKVILLLIAKPDKQTYYEIIEGIKEAVSENNYILCVSYDDPQKTELYEKPYYQAFIRQLCGIIQLGSIVNSMWLTQPGVESLPKIIIGNTDYSTKAVNIDVDHVTAAFSAVNYLCCLGYSRIAYIAGSPQNNMSRYHELGYKQALQRQKIALEKSYIISGEASFSHGQRALNQLISLPVPPNAIYCQHDILAVGAIHQAKSSGLIIPQQMAIVGFGNIELSQYYEPAITTVSYPANSIGKQAVTALLEWIRQPDSRPASQLTESEIIERKTTIKRQY